jgi:autotransporter-associated beta strand protein
VRVAQIKLQKNQTWTLFSPTALPESAVTILSAIDLNGAALKIFPQAPESDVEVNLNGLIKDSSPGATGSLNLSGSRYKNNIQLTALNTFTGPVTIGRVNVTVNSLANGGAASPLGAGNTPISFNNGNSAAGLIYSGSRPSSTDRLINLTSAGGVTLNNGGTGTLSFTSRGKTAVGTVGPRLLVLGGKNAGANTFAQEINNLGTGENITSLAKKNTGTWVLIGPNTYTGTTTIEGGILELGANAVFADTAPVELSGGTLAAETYTDTLGVLTLTSTSAITVGRGGQLIFADSSAATWAPEARLDIRGEFVPGKSIQFRGEKGLTAAQLAQITINGRRGCKLEKGFLRN